MQNYDFIIAGTGIVGLTIGKELKRKYPNSRILIYDKENTIGLHSSGRNSGVLHSGIYYLPDSLKAKFSIEGRLSLLDFCKEYNLPFQELGKILVPTFIEDDSLLDVLHERVILNFGFGKQLKLSFQI